MLTFEDILPYLATAIDEYERDVATLQSYKTDWRLSFIDTHLTAPQLRAIADELDRRNADTNRG